MTHEKLVRATLLLSVPFNFLAAWGIGIPDSFAGKMMQMPADVPAAYAALLGYLVFLFGLAYGWLAISTDINRPLLTMGVIGKGGVFFILLTLWLAQLSPGIMVVVASGDLTFAAIWGSWMLRTSSPSHTPGEHTRPAAATD